MCGVDEVGRGPLAGPVVAAAVILPPGITIDGVDDSKKLTKLRRESVFEQIVELGLVCSVGIIDNEAIDSINILQASLLAMKKAVKGLSEVPALRAGRRQLPDSAAADTADGDRTG